MTGTDVLESLASVLSENSSEGTVIAAVTGFDASGKTTISTELQSVLIRAGKPVVRITVDDFYNPRSEWKKRGPDAASLWYRRGYNYPSLMRTVEAVRRARGSRVDVEVAVFDRGDDRPLETPRMTTVEPGSIVLVEGIFLMRPALRHLWDSSVFVHAPVGALLRRGVRRDTGRLGTPGEVFDAYRECYLAAHAIYMAECSPCRDASFVIDNTDFSSPFLMQVEEAEATDDILRDELRTMPSLPAPSDESVFDDDCGSGTAPAL